MFLDNMKIKLKLQHRTAPDDQCHYYLNCMCGQINMQTATIVNYIQFLNSNCPEIIKAVPMTILLSKRARIVFGHVATAT